MSTYELRRDALTVLADGDDELAVVELAVDEGVLADGDVVSVAAYDGRPVGADGTDPEDPDPDPRGPDAVPAE